MTEPRARPAPPTARDLMTEWAVLIPSGMSVGSAAGLMAAAGADVAPVVDSGGRCVGVFTGGDYRRWKDGVEPEIDVVSEWQIVPPARPPAEVHHHMTRRFAEATLGAGVDELLQRLNGVEDPFLVVLDRQRRPRGVVCALGVLAAKANATREGNRLIPTGSAGGR